MFEKKDYTTFMAEIYNLEEAMIIEAEAIKKELTNEEAIKLVDIWINDEIRHAAIVQDLQKLIL